MLPVGVWSTCTGPFEAGYGIRRGSWGSWGHISTRLPIAKALELKQLEEAARGSHLHSAADQSSVRRTHERVREWESGSGTGLDAREFSANWPDRVGDLTLPEVAHSGPAAKARYQAEPTGQWVMFARASRYPAAEVVSPILSAARAAPASEAARFGVRRSDARNCSNAPFAFPLCSRSSP